MVNFCLWQLKVNPEFKVDWIMGHDEVAIPLGRKSDPGGCLSVTMPEFREIIKERGGEIGCWCDDDTICPRCNAEETLAKIKGGSGDD